MAQPHPTLRFFDVAHRPVPFGVARALLVGTLAMMPAMVGCQKDDKPATEAAPTAEKAAPPKAEPAKAAPAKSSDPDCIGNWSTEGDVKTIKVGASTFELRGAHLTQTNKDADSKAVLGIMAETKEDTPENLANIKAILAFFKAEGAQAIIVAGDVGETEAQITNVLKPIVATGMPVFVVIGNRDPKEAFNKAVATLGKEAPGLVNLNFVRLVSLDDVTLLSVPGYYDRSYIAPKGCQYKSSDLSTIAAAKKAAAGETVVVVSHGPPRQDGADAIDRTLEQANVGDPALTKALNEAGIKFGIFANIREAGGRATDQSGKTIINPDSMAEALFLNPGAADSVSWQLNDGTRSVGMAAVLTVDSGKAKYKVLRIPEKS